MLDNKNLPKTSTPVLRERGNIRLLTKFPPNNNFIASYEVVIESEIFKPEGGRSAMINFVDGTITDKSFFEYGRFVFFLPKSIQPIFDEILTKKGIILSVEMVAENGRPIKDQSESLFKLISLDKI